MDLGDQLHVGILDPVMHHFDKMPDRGRVAEPGGAGRSIIGAGGNCRQHRRNTGIGRRRAAGHEGGAVPGAFLTAGNTETEVANPGLSQQRLAPACVLIVGIACIDQDIPWR